MKISHANSKTITIIVALLCFIFQGCDDLEVANLNSPDRDRVLESPQEAITLLKSINSGFFQNFLIGYSNMNYDYIADQLSSASLSTAWPLCREPRERLTNEAGGTFEYVFYRDWKYAYSAIVTSNDLLRILNSWNELSDDTKKSVKAAALFLKGLATGYLGLIYKQGIILDGVYDGNVEFSDYSEVADKGVDYLKQAKEIYNSNPDLKWNYLEGFDLSSEDFVKVINTYIAKILLGKPRTHQEFLKLSFNEIQGYLDNAIEKDLTVEGSQKLYNSYQYYTLRQWSNNKFSYSVDQKIPWLLSGKTAPKKKGKKDSTPIQSKDERADSYFEYQNVSSFSYSERDLTLFSNYANTKYEVPESRYDYPANILYVSEVELLKAEVAYGLGDYALAEDILNSSNRVTVGKLPLLSGADKKTIADALFYENSIELHLVGKAVNWMFMRRWDLLQEGTMLHFPVPALESELLGKKVAVPVIGGSGSGDGIDSSKGDNSWR